MVSANNFQFFLASTTTKTMRFFFNSCRVFSSFDISCAACGSAYVKRRFCHLSASVNAVLPAYDIAHSHTLETIRRPLLLSMLYINIGIHQIIEIPIGVGSVAYAIFALIRFSFVL